MNELDGQDCCLCCNVAVDWLLIDRKSVGSVYVPLCLDHLGGNADWRDINTLLQLAGLKSKVVPASLIKYSKKKPATAGC